MTGLLRLIEISGTPFDRGRQYGREAAREIAVSIGHYGSQIGQLGLGGSELDAVIERYLPLMEDFSPRLVEEMRGTAVGAGVDFRTIVMINARTEMLKIAANPALRASLFEEVEADGCTSAVVTPRASADGRIIHAHNWDWKKEAADAVVILRIRNEDGPDILTFTEAGALCRFGLNSNGIAVTANYLESDRDYRNVGVPLAMIRRQILEESNLALGLRCAYTSSKSGSNNILISEAHSGLTFDLECAPDETFPVEPSDGLLVHANHWQSPVALSKLKDRGIANMPDSLYRDRRLRDLLEQRVGALNVSDVKAALADSWASPWSVCRPPRPSAMNNLTATVASLVMRPDEGLMEIAMLPAFGARYESYRLDMATASPGSTR